MAFKPVLAHAGFSEIGELTITWNPIYHNPRHGSSDCVAATAAAVTTQTTVFLRRR